jgi:hypothetical protein
MATASVSLLSYCCTLDAQFGLPTFVCGTVTILIVTTLNRQSLWQVISSHLIARAAAGRRPFRGGRGCSRTQASLAA